MKEIFKEFAEDTRDGGFEKCCKAILEQMGYTCELTSKTCDNGIDIIATKDGVRLGVQCKNQKSNVSSIVIRTTKGSLSCFKLDKGLVCTTSYFSKPAKECASKEKCDIELWDWDAIQEKMKIYLTEKIQSSLSIEQINLIHNIVKNYLIVNDGEESIGVKTYKLKSLIEKKCKFYIEAYELNDIIKPLLTPIDNLNSINVIYNVSKRGMRKLKMQ